MDIKDKLKNLHSINMLIESLERLLECDREEFKNFSELLEGLEQDSLQEIAKLKRQKLEIESLINSLDNDLQRKVLIEHYSHGYKWDKVADDLGYSKAYLSNLRFIAKPLNSWRQWFKILMIILGEKYNKGISKNGIPFFMQIKNRGANHG